MNEKKMRMNAKKVKLIKEIKIEAKNKNGVCGELKQVQYL